MLESKRNFSRKCIDRERIKEETYGSKRNE